LQGDGVAELLELVDESAGAVFGGAVALCPVRPEVGVVDLVVDDVPVGDEYVVAGGADGFVQVPAATDVGVVGGEVGVFCSGGGMGGFDQRGAQGDGAVSGPVGSVFPTGGVVAWADTCPGGRRCETRSYPRRTRPAA
jgi:hypothetical protein